MRFPVLTDKVVRAEDATSATDDVVYSVTNMFTGTGNKVAGLDLWHEGKPSPVMVASDVSAIPSLVWGYSDATTGEGTMGKRQVKGLTLGQFIGLKDS